MSKSNLSNSSTWKYRMGPFRALDIDFNNRLQLDRSINKYFKDRFNHGNYSFQLSGRNALGLALSHYDLKEEDEVAILTPTNNFYISGCVTREIEKFCQWKRVISEKTKIILVIHEFGVPYENLENLTKMEIPIIEDCAYSFFSSDRKGRIGKIGEFVIYSFPKMFPIEFGGLLISNLKSKLKNNYLNKDKLEYVQKVLSYYIQFHDLIINRRKEIYIKMGSKVKDFGFHPRFMMTPGMVPGVFMFTVKDERLDLDSMKRFVQQHGIECSVFYGERAFFIPLHQNLNDEDLDYFAFVLQKFIQKTEI
ncbi:DegT/DnrJ/EryC1/StrS family aminotransferase [Lutimonas saemankumensis]|uniref:DegT/DnrJ/EryC1/StrS family aminotransferase n=1 Tax=Lutimonas saemankumensis TaxID=483016 RepID=UPI001CD5EA61|nr:DegT/DnrJ/EryC1/StrS family aminotransferase [Lutimonas saemankumensis]MCA0932657.1 DegT/DnrJ/EryC1/StrS family aminotransferase [Lutimonas saemankumensis]